MRFEHFNPVAIVFGSGTRHGLPQLLRGRTLLITGERTLERDEWPDLLNENVRRSSPVPPNPGDRVVDRLLGEASAHEASTIVGIGGGSALDAAKVVAMLIGNWTSIAEYRERQAPRPRLAQLIQVPTTAGTGSEVTRWASLWNEGVKSSVDEAQGFADLAVIDPELCRGMPRRLALATGLDAMSHAMESLWGIHSTPLSQGYAMRALSLLTSHLEKACAGDADDRDWERLAESATLAGPALSCTRSAAAHALSYELTGRFGLEHGLAVGLLCKSLLSFNEQAAPEGIHAILAAMGYSSVLEARNFIDRCFHLAGLQPGLAPFGIDSEEFPSVIEQAVASNRFGNNPGALDRETLLEVLRAIA